MSVNEIELHFKRYVQHTAMDRDIYYELDARVIEQIWGDLLFGLQARLLTDQLPPETVSQRKWVPFKVPASTWQMWKKQHADSWYARRLVNRWPVRYDGSGAWAECTLSLERFLAYPESRVRTQGQAVRMYDTSTNWTIEEGTGL
jgi:hypothetical protein